jgi:hypothetical protein
MKKIAVLICSLFIVGTIYMQSCTPEPSPCNNDPSTGTGDDDPNPFEVDEMIFQGQMDVCDFISGANDSSGMYYSCEAIALIVAAGGSADYGTGGRISTRNRIYAQNACSKTNVNQINLPNEYKVEGNPFEYIGVLHNRNMFQILNSPNKEVELNKILNGNDESFESLTSIYLEVKQINASNEKKEVLKNQLKQLVVNYRNKVTDFRTFSFSKASANLNLPADIFKEVKAKMKETNNNTASVINLINRRITDILNSFDIEDKTANIKLMSLSLLKHSYYYWYN